MKNTTKAPSPDWKATITHWRVNDRFTTIARNAAAAKRHYQATTANAGGLHTMRARAATPEEIAAYADDMEKRFAVMAERKVNPLPTDEELLAILEEAALVIYEQAHPGTAGQDAYDRAQSLRNGRLEKAIIALRREIGA